MNNVYTTFYGPSYTSLTPLEWEREVGKIHPKKGISKLKSTTLKVRDSYLNTRTNILSGRMLLILSLRILIRYLLVTL